MGLVDEVEKMIGRVQRYFAEHSVDGARIEVNMVGRTLDEVPARERGVDYRDAVSKYNEFRRESDLKYIMDSEDNH